MSRDWVGGKHYAGRGGWVVRSREGLPDPKGREKGKTSRENGSSRGKGEKNGKRMEDKVREACARLQQRAVGEARGI